MKSRRPTNVWSRRRTLFGLRAKKLFRIPLLEIQAANACNLTCESCSHFSNSGHKGMIDLNEADRWMKLWNQRLWPKLFRLLGGEPTLNPQLTDMVRLAHKNWPQSRVALTTNGFFAHRHTDLGKALGEASAKVILTIHDRTEEYTAKAAPGLQLFRQWSEEFGFELIIEESHIRWTRRYTGTGAHVLPFEDNNLRGSWDECSGRNCRQLFRGKLWKCASIAYLQLQKENHPGISEKWDPYLAYKPLEPDCSDDELARFFQAEEESICGMCPAEPERFDKASPLIPLSVICRREQLQAAGVASRDGQVPA